ncbi:hypothetical protein CR983_00240 [Candidatus Saccharibacteria bacterium]|nr:MAG: hypothetical protein CR983_00240 [Candidatus Saccharibacteria bacterium]
MGVIGFDRGGRPDPGAGSRGDDREIANDFGLECPENVADETWQKVCKLLGEACLAARNPNAIRTGEAQNAQEEVLRMVHKLLGGAAVRSTTETDE